MLRVAPSLLRMWVVACTLLTAATERAEVVVDIDGTAPATKEPATAAVSAAAATAATAATAAVAAEKPTIVFGWHIGPGSGWGMLGVNLMTALASR